MTARTMAELAWFEALFDMHQRRAFGLAYRFLGDAHDAEDAVQEAFLSAWRSGQTPDVTADSTRSWLLAIVRNRAIDVLRARRRRQAVALDDATEPVDPTDVPLDVERSSDQQQARRVLQALPHEQRQVVELAYFEGLTHVEIADRLQLPLGTVKGRIRLGLERLRSTLFGHRDPSISA